MRAEVKDWILLMGKSVLVILGGILVAGGLVELVVAGSTRKGWGALLVGLLLCVPPMAFAFRDALRGGRDAQGPQRRE